MKINRNNYEQYFIDYLDGRLSAAMAMELSKFLDKNPDLKEELESFENINVNLQDSYNFSEKENLKKTVIQSSGKITSKNYNNYFIAFHEGDLSTEEQAEVNTFIALNPQLRAEFKLFGASYLQTNETIVFANKKDLKKYPFWIVKTWYKAVGVAASIILLIGLFNFFQPTNIFNQPAERLGVPTQIKGKKAQGFELNFAEQTPESREYQITVTHTEEIMPEEPLFAMSAIEVPIESVIASLPKVTAENEVLTFKDEYDVLTKELMIKEELLLASYGETNPNAREKVEKALWAKSFGKQKRRKSREEKIGDENKKARINLWTLASIGLESFNEITGSNVNIERTRNKEGEKKKYILVNANVESSETTDTPDKPYL